MDPRKPRNFGASLWHLDFHFASAGLGRQRPGLFAKNGLNVEPVQIRGGAVSTMAIMSGQAVLSGVGAGSVVAARVEGGDIVLLACPADLEPVYLIARPEIKSRIRSQGQSGRHHPAQLVDPFLSAQRRRMVGMDSDKEMTLLQLGGSAGDQQRAGRRQESPQPR